MDWSKAKKLIILLLALANLFLVGNLAYLSYKNNVIARETVRDLVEYLDSRGIKLAEDIVPKENLGRSILVIEHTAEADVSAAESLLSSEETLSFNDNGTYQTEEGIVNLRTGGYLEANLYAVRDARELASLLEKGGVSLWSTTYTADTAEFRLSYRDLPVFNCNLSATQTEDVWMVSGRVCLGNALRADSGYERDIAGLIVGITQRLVLRNTTEIFDIEAGWVAGSISNVGLRLTPVYKLSTDSDDFYINAVDGTLMSVEV